MIHLHVPYWRTRWPYSSTCRPWRVLPDKSLVWQWGAFSWDGLGSSVHPAPHSTAVLPVLPGPHSVCMGAWASEKLLLFLSLVLISTCLTCTIAFYMYIHNCTKVRTDVDMSKGMAAKAVHVIVCIEGVTAVQCRRDGNQSHAHT